ERGEVSEIIIAGDGEGLPMDELLECRFRGIAITRAATFVERECGRIPVELVDAQWWLDRRGFGRSALRRACKRSFDTLAGALILLLAAPVMLACALAIRLEGSGSSVLFRQMRV